MTSNGEHQTWNCNEFLQQCTDADLMGVDGREMYAAFKL